MNSFNNQYRQHDIIGFNSYLSKVFTWMFTGLTLSFVIAYVTSHSPTILSILIRNPLSLFILAGIEFFLVIKISRNVTRYSYSKSSGLFMLYSFINGLTLSFIFLVYDIGMIATAFIVAAVLFGAMAIYGKSTKKDLSGLGSFLFMGIIGIVIASIINIFLQSSAMDFIISGIGVIVFTGLTAWDMQKLKKYYYSYGNSEISNNIAVMGALSLYLDFINIFIYILRIFGRRN